MKTVLRQSLKRLALVAGSALSIMGFASGNAYAVLLPSVEPCGAPYAANLLCYTTSTGAKVYVASQHDNFVSYSSNVLASLSKDFGYAELHDWENLGAFGSGQIIKLFTFNNATNGTFPVATGGTDDNENNPAPGTDETPKHDGEYFGRWPVNATVTVGDMQTYLGPDLHTPVFTFDLNETAPGLFLNGYLEIVRSNNTSVVFAFDNEFNSAYDANSLVEASRTFINSWYDPLNSNCPAGLCSMSVDTGVGSGKPDFVAYAQALDLRDFDPGDTLHFYLKLTDIEGGGEELTLTSFFMPTTKVPEPNMLALIGIGLLGFGGIRAHRNLGVS